MSVTLTVNYKEVFSEETIDKIDELLEDNYSLDDILEFIDVNSEGDFIAYYEEYVTFGEEHSYDAVDAFIDEFGFADLSSFEDAYQGEYGSKAEYVENYVTDCYCVDMPAFLEIDWEASFDNMDVVYSNGYVFNTYF